MEIKQAEVQKKSVIGQNNAAKEVAESNAELEVIKAEAEGFEAMVKAAERNPEFAIQYKRLTNGKKSLRNRLRHLNISNRENVTVFDGGNGTTSNSLQNVVSKVTPALGILDKLPIHDDTYQNIVNPSSKENAQNEPEKEDF